MERTFTLPSLRATIAVGAALSLLVTAFIAFAPGDARAGTGFEPVITVTPTGNDERPEWEYSWEVADGEEDCATNIRIFPEGAESQDDEIDTAVVLEETSATAGTFALPELQAGVYEAVILVCTLNGTEFEFGTSQRGADPLAFARLTLTKAVEGDAPEGSTFLVEVACESQLFEDVSIDGVVLEETDDRLVLTSDHDGFDPDTIYERDFGAAGGDAQVVFYAEALCRVDETETGGAESTSIEGAEVEVDDAIEYETTVTNVFPAVDEVEDEVEEEAEPAEAVEEEPDFTG